MPQEVKLKSLSKNGQPPTTRLATAIETVEIVDQLIEANERRCATDAKLKGMIDGNPPYDNAALIEAAQSWRCNTNWRIGEAFLNIALSIYWDIVSEGPTKATCVTEWGESQGQSQDWSGIITEEFERLNKRDSSLNNMFRDSQHDMVLYRMGPVMWEDAFDFRAKPVKCANLLTLDGTKSDINKWTLAAVRSSYRADELYSFIRYPEAAKKSGWSVETAKKVLMDTYPIASYPNKKQDWEFYQRRLNNNDIYWSMECESIPVSHVFVREFAKPGESEGRISHFSVVEGQTNDDYLFKKIGRYENWGQAICPFYYDTGDSTHHSVKGLGIKAYSSLDAINKLMCHEVDLAFIGSAINFQFQSAADKEKMQLMQFGPVNFWPEGITMIQSNSTGQLIQAPSFIRKDILSTVTANLAQYRQGQEREKGNPRTAREVGLQAENQNFINRSGVTFYFEQEDAFYAERFRRAANPNLTERNSGGKEALEFQRRCKKRGVPKEALQKMASVTATRTVGYGSADARLQSLNRLLMRLPLYGEAGRERILEDITAADVGHTLMRRYMPESGSSPSIDFQRDQARDKVALLRLNIMPEVMPHQNAAVFAETFIAAAAQSLEGLSQGQGDPIEIIAFVEIAGQAAGMHIQRMAQDETRKQVHDALLERLEKIGELKDEIEAQIQKSMQQNGQQQQKTQRAMSDEQLAEAKLKGDLSRKERKLQVDLKSKTEKTRFGMQLQAMKEQQSRAIKDITTAQEIELARLKARENNGDE